MEAVMPQHKLITAKITSHIDFGPVHIGLKKLRQRFGIVGTMPHQLQMSGQAVAADELRKVVDISGHCALGYPRPLGFEYGAGVQQEDFVPGIDLGDSLQVLRLIVHKGEDPIPETPKMTDAIGF
jgi:hypothetical protein